MKKFLYLLLILSSFIPESNSQNCTGDSVVIYHRREVYGGLLITTDTFEIATGIRKIIKEKFQGLVVMFSIIIIAHISLGHTLKGMLKMTQQVTMSFKEQEPDMIIYSKRYYI